MKNTIGLISANYTNDSFGVLTEGRTLATLPYGGRYRIIDFTLSNMINAGINTIGLITPYNYRSIIDHVGVGKAWSLDRKAGGLFLLPGSIYGIRSASSKFLQRDLIQNRLYFDRDTADYVILSGTSKIYNMDLDELIDAHEESGREITLLCKRVGNMSREDEIYIETDLRGQVTDLVNGHPLMAKAGSLYLDCFIINRTYLINMLDWFGALEHMDLLDIIRDNLSRIDVGVCYFSGHVLPIGSPMDYMRANMALLDWDVRSELFYDNAPISTNVQDEAPAQYSPGANVKNSLISTGCIIEGTVENSILFRNCHIAKGAVVKNSILMRRAVISEDALAENVICDQYVTFGEGVRVVGKQDDPIKIGKRTRI